MKRAFSSGFGVADHWKQIFRLGKFLCLALFLSGCFQAEIRIEILSSSEGRTTTTINLPRAAYDQMMRSNGRESQFCEAGDISVNDAEVSCITSKKTALTEIALGYPYSGEFVSVVQLDEKTYRIVIPMQLLTAMASDDFSRDDPDSRMMVNELFKGARLKIIISGAEVLATNMRQSDDRTSASFSIDIPTLMLDSNALPPALTAMITIK